MKAIFDWHKKGVFAVKDPQGNVLFDTFADTAYSARALWCRSYNKLASKLAEQGYVMAEFELKLGDGISTARVVEVNTDMDAVKSNVIFVPTDAPGWSLHLDSPYADDAARAIGEKLETLLKAAIDAGRVTLEEGIFIRDEMFEEMNNYRSFGARDTEPEAILVRTIEECFGLPDQSVSR